MTANDFPYLIKSVTLEPLLRRATWKKTVSDNYILWKAKNHQLHKWLQHENH